ncbi:MAG: spermidine/putrescine transport system substrate-binding protein, partial [Chloroflexota bacterium]|nr:spermidine/putrescine transport system substrate-binding protein [Chloroflexota bacterium]
MAERDLDDVLRRMSQTKVNRRGFLAAAGLTGTAAALAACGPSGAATAAPSTVPASAAPAPSTAVVESAAPSFEIEKELLMYNWAAYVSPDNMEKFKTEFGVETFTYDVYDNNEVLIAKLQGGASGYDIAAPTAEYVPGMVDEGFLQKLDLSRLPNLEYINKAFKNLWWDPTNEYQVPKDYGTTGILYMKSLLSKIPQSWKEFYDSVKGEASGKTVFVDSMGDVFVVPLKMLGFSANSVEKAELDQARTILLDVAPHLYALESNVYGQ